MSTRCTISHSDDFHLYQECFEQDNVYLNLDSGDWSALLETAAVDWRDGGSAKPRLHVRMNVTLWRRIIEGWIGSKWAQSPQSDHKKMDFDPQDALSWLENFNSKKEKVEVKDEE
jgi:hypothetical protein